MVVGGSEDLHKPGGKALKNLIDNKYSGQIFVVNPKADSVQGQKCFKKVEDLPQVDVAILAIPAHLCPAAVECLCKTKETKGIIVFSAGFSEENKEGAALEAQMRDSANRYGVTLIGPNCVGYMNQNYTGVFTTPIPKFIPYSIDLISGSGATALFIIDAAVQLGIPFANVFSVGNSAQIGVEDVLKYLDETYVDGVSAPVKILYIESIKNPQLLLKHAASLRRKGAYVAAVKAGYSEAGSRAASSHTGALASPDTAVTALFNKAGIIRCNGRNQLLTVACILLKKAPKGRNICIVTHAGGPAVMLTDILSSNGINIPQIPQEMADKLLEKLFPGSSASNPIDFLATGTAAQLGQIMDFVSEECPQMNGMPIIFGSPGLNSVQEVYDLLDQKMDNCRIPVYPIFPSTLNVTQELVEFQKKGRIYFPDEVVFGAALVRVMDTPEPEPEKFDLPPVDSERIREVIHRSKNGYLPPEDVRTLLDATGLIRAKEETASTEEEVLNAAKSIGYPLVMKVIGPIHKSDVGGVRMNIDNDRLLVSVFKDMMKIKDTTAVLLQSQLSGRELFIGAKREGSFGHTILCGLGGIFVEVLKDVSVGLSPISKGEAERMIDSLRCHKLIKGVRGQEGVNRLQFIDAIRRISALCQMAPEIFEMDINPLLGTEKSVVAVDARIRIERKTFF